jgi:hypothetical protein
MSDHETTGFAHVIEPERAEIARAQITALTQRLDDRVRALPSHLPADATPEALEAALMHLKRVHGVLDTVLLAARRRDE